MTHQQTGLLAAESLIEVHLVACCVATFEAHQPSAVAEAPAVSGPLGPAVGPAQHAQQGPHTQHLPAELRSPPAWQQPPTQQLIRSIRQPAAAPLLTRMSSPVSTSLQHLGKPGQPARQQQCCVLYATMPLWSSLMDQPACQRWARAAV